MDPFIGKFAERIRYFPATTRDPLEGIGRITETLAGGQALADLGLAPIMPDADRAMVCGSLAFNLDVRTVREGFGHEEGANNNSKRYVVEKAFVSDGI